MNEISMLAQNVKKLSVEENITQESHIPSKDVEKYLK